MIACLEDDDQSNNRLDNLRWGTHGDNRQDARRNGRLAVGGRSPHAKLTEDDIPEIRALAAAGVPQKHIAKQKGVESKAIRRILRGEGWKHV